MKIKTSELSGVALNYAVAIACGYKCALDSPENGPDEWIVMGREDMWLERDPDYFDVWSPSTDWSQGGPLIERFKIQLEYIGPDWHGEKLDLWEASPYSLPGGAIGESMLIASCRAIVAAKLGDEVDVPEGLV